MTQYDKIYQYLKEHGKTNRIRLGTELYIVDVPKAVSIFNQKAKRSGSLERITGRRTRNGTKDYSLNLDITKPSFDPNAWDYTKDGVAYLK